MRRCEANLGRSLPFRLFIREVCSAEYTETAKLTPGDQGENTASPAVFVHRCGVVVSAQHHSSRAWRASSTVRHARVQTMPTSRSRRSQRSPALVSRSEDLSHGRLSRDFNRNMMPPTGHVLREIEHYLSLRHVHKCPVSRPLHPEVRTPSSRVFGLLLPEVEASKT